MAEIDDPRVRPALEAMMSGDAPGLTTAIVDDPEIVHVRWGENTLMEWVTQPPHGIADDIVEVLIECGSSLDRALNLAACWNLDQLCSRLLRAGGDPAVHDVEGVTPLETAAMHGATRSADVLLGAGVHRRSLWLAAATGAMDALGSWVAPDGRLVRRPGPERPDWAAIGEDVEERDGTDVGQIVGEAFVLAAANGRVVAADRLMRAGASVDSTTYRRTTALHLAIRYRNIGAVGYLLGHGASTTVTDDVYHSDAHGWAAALRCDDPRTQRIDELVNSGRR